MHRAAVALSLVLAPLTASSGLNDRQEALGHYRDGQELMLTEKWDKAAEEFTEAVKLDPLFGQAHHDLGLCRMALREYPAALKAFGDSREAFRQVWDMQSTDSVKADMRIEEEIQQVRDAIVFAQTVVRENQRSPFIVMKYQDRISDLERQKRRARSGAFEAPPEVSLGLGSAHLRLGHLEDAEREYQAAIKARPRFGEAHNNLAVVYLKKGRIPEAEQEIKAAEKSGFTVPPGLKDEVKAARQ